MSYLRGISERKSVRIFVLDKHAVCLHCLFYHCAPVMFVLYSSVLDVLQSMVEFCQDGTGFVAKGVGDVVVWVNNFG